MGWRRCSTWLRTLLRECWLMLLLGQHLQTHCLRIPVKKGVSVRTAWLQCYPSESPGSVADSAYQSVIIDPRSVTCNRNPKSLGFLGNGGVGSLLSPGGGSGRVTRCHAVSQGCQREWSRQSTTDRQSGGPNLPPGPDGGPIIGEYAGIGGHSGGVVGSYSVISETKGREESEEDVGNGEVTEEAKPGEITDEDIMKMKVALSQASTLGVDFVKCIETLQTSPYCTVSPTTVAYNSALSAAERNSNAKLTLAIVEDMRKKQGALDTVSYKLAVCTCAKCGYTDEALQLYDEMIRNGHSVDHGVMRAIMAQLAREGRGLECLKIFEEMKKLDKVCKTDNTFIQVDDYMKLVEACSKAQMYEEALEAYKEMKKLKNYSATSVILNEVLALFNAAGFWEEAMEVYADHLKERRAMTLYHYKLLMNTLLMARKFAHLESVYNNMRQEAVPMDSVAYQMALEGYAKTGQFKKALKVIEAMEAEGYLRERQEPFTAAVEACRQSGEWKLALQLLRRASEHNAVKSIAMYNAVLAVVATAEEWDTIISLYREIANVCKESAGGGNQLAVDGDTVAYALMAHFYTGDNVQVDKLLQLPVVDTPLLLKIRSSIQAEQSAVPS